MRPRTKDHPAVPSEPGQTGPEAGPRSAEGGFVLPLVVVTIGVISLALWAAISVIETTQADIGRLRQRIELEKAALTAEARAIFLLASEPLGGAGLRVGGQRFTIGNPTGRADEQDDEALWMRDPRAAWSRILRLDSRPYRSVLPDGSEVMVEIQDEAGLFNVNLQDPLAIERLLAAADVEETSARSLADALADFIDRDDLKRLNGAEAPEYRRAGLSPPVNRWLMSGDEVFGAFGWREGLDASLRKRLADLTTASSVTAPFNINTAPEPVLRGWFALDADAAAQVVREREMRVLTGPGAITQLTGQPLVEQDFRLYAFPANRFRIRIYRPGSESGEDYIELRLRLTMQNAERPFYFDLSAAKTFPPGASRPVTDYAEVTPLIRSPHLLGD